MKALFIVLVLAAFPAMAGSDSECVFVLTAHNVSGALVAVDTEGPFSTKDECEGVGLVITRRIMEVIGKFQPEDTSASEWDKLTSSCEEVKQPYSSNA